MRSIIGNDFQILVSHSRLKFLPKMFVAIAKLKNTYTLKLTNIMITVNVVFYQDFLLMMN